MNIRQPSCRIFLFNGMEKIHVHHKYSKKLFKKLAHNTTNHIFDSESVICEFNEIKYCFIFNEEFNDDEGLHLIDYFTLQNLKHDTQDYEIVNNIYESIKDKTDWFITIFRTEKIFNDIENKSYQNIEKLEKSLKQFTKHNIVSDNLILNNAFKNKYSNFTYGFTNTIFEWNNIIGVRWYYEFKDIFHRLNYKYDLCYAVRNYKDNRVKILNGLNKLNHNILTIRTDSNMNESYDKNKDILGDVQLNSIYGKTDFDDVSLISDLAIGADLFFRILSSSKMQVLDESWSWYKGEFNSQYLSEKTIGLLLAEIPFISTHTYPLDMVSEILNIPIHPFYNKSLNGNPLKFIEFVNDFMGNFDYNYNICREWSRIANISLMNKINTENSLLEIIKQGFEKNNTINLI